MLQPATPHGTLQHTWAPQPPAPATAPAKPQHPPCCSLPHLRCTMLTPSLKGSATTSTRLSLITNWLNSRMASAISSLTGPGEYTLPCSMMATGRVVKQLGDHRAVGHRQPTGPAWPLCRRSALQHQGRQLLARQGWRPCMQTR